jgi:hypothetical protein
MIAVLLMFLLFAVLQVAVYFYVRNIVQSGAAAGARYAANKGVSTTQGGDRASILIRQGSTRRVSQDVPCGGTPGTDPSGLPLAVVHCGGHLKSIFLPLGRVLSIDVTARALKEGEP